MLEYILLLGPILFVIVSTILSVVTPNYDWKNDYISELSLGKYGWIQKFNFVFCGIAIFGLCILLAGSADNLTARLGWYVGSMLGIPTALAGIWDTDIKRSTRTFAGKLHEWIYHVGILGTGLAYILVGWGYKNNLVVWIGSWSIAIFDLLWWNYSTLWGVKPGVGQRIVIFSALTWVVTMALWTISN